MAMMGKSAVDLINLVNYRRHDIFTLYCMKPPTIHHRIRIVNPEKLVPIYRTRWDRLLG